MKPSGASIEERDDALRKGVPLPLGNISDALEFVDKPNHCRIAAHDTSQANELRDYFDDAGVVLNARADAVGFQSLQVWQTRSRLHPFGGQRLSGDVLGAPELQRLLKVAGACG